MASLRNLNRVLCAIDGNPETWFSVLESMGASRYEHVRSAAGEALYKMKEAPKEWSGIVGEARKSLSFLDIPALFDGLKKPDFSLSVLCERRCNVYLIIPPEYAGVLSPYIRLLCGVAMLYKQRRPDAPRLVALLDEIGQIGPAPFVLRALTYGRGSGLQTQVIYQSFGQIAAQFGHEGAQTAISSCAVRQVFGVRDLETAEKVSRMLGTQTLSFDDGLTQAAARTRKSHIVRQLMDGGDPFAAGLDYAQQERASINRTKQARPLLTPSEILGMPEDRQLLFVSGIGCPPVAAYRKPFFLHRELAGRFLPNPYHNERDGYVRVPGFFGPTWKRVITEPVPECFADYPQYQSGYWSYVEGYRPPTI